MKTIHALGMLTWFLAAGTLAAQSPKVDSLLHALETNTTADRAEMLWGVAYELYDVDNASALDYCRRAYDQALPKGDSLQIVKIGTTYGQLLRRMDKVHESIEVSSFLLPVAKRHGFRKYTKMLHNSLALTHTFMEHFDKALYFHSESLSMRRAEGDANEIAVTLNNIGVLYYKVGDYRLALQNYKEALRIDTKGHRVIVLGNIGLCYAHLKEYDSALFYLDNNLILAENEKRTNDILRAEFGLGLTYFKLKDFETAEQHLQTSLKLAIEEGSQRFQIDNLKFLALLSLKQDKLEQCELYLRRIDEMPALTAYPGAQADVRKDWADLQFAKGQFRSAGINYRKYIELKEAVVGKEMNNRLRMAHTEIAQQESNSRIEAQAQIVGLQEEVIGRQRWVIGLSTALAMLGGGFALVLVKTNRRKSRINDLLNRRVRERTAELEQERDASRHAQNEQSLAVQKATRELSASLATLTGLSQAAARDLPREQAVYFQKAEATAEKMAQTVVQFKSTA
ncbi:MAG: tetratricopeptide repeat protein [Cytophagales bacterium]|nr:tetratricopeptide repeat protein [Cytophagales bacterium]